jgi:hypothetical protein
MLLHVLQLYIWCSCAHFLDVYIIFYLCSIIIFFGDQTSWFIYTDLIFVLFKAEFRFFYSGSYRYDSFFIVYSILLIADFRFFVVLVKSGLYILREEQKFDR